MVEVEAKLRLPSCSLLGELRSRLQRLGAELLEEKVEEDTYYQHPCRDFAATDEALRLRVTSTGAVEATYKGPKRVLGRGKARSEYTLHLRPDELGEARAVLLALGFKPVATVRKTRAYYRLGNLLITLDTVEGLGCFAEIEYAARDASPEEAMKAIDEAIEKLGLQGAEPVHRSYLELLLERGAPEKRQLGSESRPRRRG